MRTFAIGDPQAPFASFLAILEQHELLTPSKRLRDDVALVSMGDHFDWGKKDERAKAASDAMELVKWLASHDPEQAIMIAGNHDLARVGELWGIDDATFSRAQALADRAYLEHDADAEAQFHREFPSFTTAEVVARDLSTFKREQSDIVLELLKTRRLKLAHAHAGTLLVHAGVTSGEREVLGLASNASASEWSAALNRALAAAVDTSTGSIAIPGLHSPGDAEREGLGMLYHRPSRGLPDPQKADEEQRELARPPPRRRFDPATIPRGLVQAVGHIRDTKCRRLMADICDDAPPRDGVLRSLVVDDAGLRYRHGVQEFAPEAAAMLFLDGAMSSCPPADYQLLDVDALVAT